ncbi:hypothetical protein ACFVAE_06090 [Microbacterium sp. NPDC057659]|uniref:hypothetical protein n=1 Tax=Microbacterium sp. NPDC057659 TaxID=3346198 RepID=UPI00366ADA75
MATPRAVMEHVGGHRRDLCTVVVDDRYPQACGGQDAREVVDDGVLVSVIAEFLPVPPTSTPRVRSSMHSSATHLLIHPEHQ